MKQKVDSQLFRGNVNKDFLANYMYTFTDEGNYQPIMRKGDNIKLYQSYMLGLSEGYGKPYMSFISSSWAPFVSLLDKSIKIISENLYDIYPDIGKIEFDMNSKALEIFQTEKAIQTAGITMVPDIWVDETQQCFPAIKCTTTRYPSGIRIPLEDAKALSTTLNCFDPHIYGLVLLGLLGK